MSESEAVLLLIRSLNLSDFASQAILYNGSCVTIKTEFVTKYFGLCMGGKH